MTKIQIMYFLIINLENITYTNQLSGTYWNQRLKIYSSLSASKQFTYALITEAEGVSDTISYYWNITEWMEDLRL